jgi:lipoprotein NlpI
MIKLTRHFLILGCALFVHSALADTGKAAQNASRTGDVISSKGFNYRIAPPPTYVERANNLPAQDIPDTGDAIFVFIDRQASLAGAEPQLYMRHAIKPLTTSALRDASQIYILFNPEYQKLTLHSIRIWRDGKAIDMTRKVKLDLMRRESNLEKNLYEGNVTAVGILPSTRVGDIIDAEYTLSGENPIFGKHYANLFTVTQLLPTAHYRFLLTTPENRAIKVQSPPDMPVKESRINQSVRYTVESADIKLASRDDGVPAWHPLFKIIQTSEYQDWAQVGAWANELFRNTETLSPELQAQIKIWKDSGLSQEQLTAEALRWVQGHVRYFGIELGVNSHLPSPPNLTAERKFGDCKDKSLLLATLLKALDIPAEPVLASVKFNRNTEKMLPSPAVFDHAIVRVQLNGKTWWLDPTFLPQYGTLDKISATEYGGVLVLGDQESAQLQKADYPPGFDSLYQKTSRFTAQSPNEPVRLTVELKSNRNTADAYRYARDSLPKDEFDKLLQTDILRVYPSARQEGDMGFNDDRDNNQITMTANFLIEDFFRYEPGRLIAEFSAPELQWRTLLPRQSARNTPFALPAHARAVETIELSFPDNDSMKVDKSSMPQNGEFWSFSDSHDLQKNKLSQTWTLRANKDAVPAQKMPEFITETQGIRAKTGSTIRIPVSKLSDADARKLEGELSQLLRAYGKSKSGRVNVEITDALNLVITSNDIASEKLGGKALAEAYHLRSVAFDDRGDMPRALDDARMARKLNPEKTDYLKTEAIILMAGGRMEEARQLFEQIIQENKLSGTSLADVYRSYGETLYYLGKKDHAREMFDEALRHNPTQDAGMLYTAIWRYLAAADTDPNAAPTLASAMNDMQEQDWPYPVGEMLLNKITPAQLLEKAASDDKGVQADQYCEAHFYTGKKYQMNGNREKANESFTKSVELGVMPFLENSFALYELGKKREPKTQSFWEKFL